ncbi:hypothetical protein HY406_01735 [Candidatus Giovannonibacteria bacterium]|nr:hypothetical protein [Candidatus Giovannonibacteria bacterium]
MEKVLQALPKIPRKRPPLSWFYKKAREIIEASGGYPPSDKPLGLLVSGIPDEYRYAFQEFISQEKTRVRNQKRRVA